MSLAYIVATLRLRGFVVDYDTDKKLHLFAFGRAAIEISEQKRDVLEEIILTGAN